MNNISTGYYRLDRILGGGIKKKSLLLFVGSVPEENTALALNIAATVALGKRAQTVLFFSTKNCRHALLEKLVARESGISLDIVQQAAFIGNKELVWPSSRIIASPLFIVDGNWHPKRLTDIVGISKGEVIPGHWNKTMSSPCLIIIDDITGVWNNLWGSPRKFRSAREHSRSVLKGLKELAIALNAAVVGIVPVYYRGRKTCTAQPRELEKLFGKETISDKQVFLHGTHDSAEHRVELYAADSSDKVGLIYDPTRSHIYEN